MTNSWVSLALALTTFLGAAAVTAGERLVALYFPQRHFALPGKWVNPRFTGAIDSDSRVIAELRDVELRLLIPPRFTSPPQEVSIFLLLPARIQGLRATGGLTLTWTARGRFNAGTVRPGESSLLFEGVVDSPELRDFINFTFVIDAREMLKAIRLEPIYEIELR